MKAFLFVLLIVIGSVKGLSQSSNLTITSVSGITSTMANVTYQYKGQFLFSIEHGICIAKSGSTPTVDDMTFKNPNSGPISPFCNPYITYFKGLTPKNSYSARAYIVLHDKSVLYSNTETFTTLDDLSNTVTDYDGNIYTVVRIGDQVWMAENLRVTHYRNGESIQNITDNARWVNTLSGAFCDVDNDITGKNRRRYGAIYNFSALIDSRGVAPSGWHVATDADYKTLISFVGNNDPNIATPKIVALGEDVVCSNTSGPKISQRATNSSGASFAMGYGRSGTDGKFIRSGWWYTGTEELQRRAVIFGININGSIPGKSFWSSSLYNKADQIDGWAVRCVKD